MPQYGWSSCPGAIRQQVEGLTADLAAILGPALCGVYLHGSLAMRCFNPERSDIDLLVVTRERMDTAMKRGVGEALLRWSNAPRPIEISFLAQAHLDPWQYPPPFDLHYSEEWRGLYERHLRTGEWNEWSMSARRDPDLAAHIAITNARGVSIHGLPIRDVFPVVPPVDYLASILYDVEEAPHVIEENPVYAVLNLCRVRRYLHDGAIGSKDEGGAWAEGVLDTRHAAIVSKALVAYRETGGGINAAPESLAAFANEMLEEIHRTSPLAAIRGAAKNRDTT